MKPTIVILAIMITLAMNVAFAGETIQEQNSCPDTYTAYGTLYVLPGNPNMSNYSYDSSQNESIREDRLTLFRSVLVSESLLNAVAENLTDKYPGLSATSISDKLSLDYHADFDSVIRVSCKTEDPELSADICNTVLDILPSELKDVLGAGQAQVIDYASIPEEPDKKEGGLFSIFFNPGAQE